MMAFCPEHPKWDQNPKFTPLSETTSIPTPLRSPPPGLVIGRQVSQYRRPKHSLWLNKRYIWNSETKIVKRSTQQRYRRLHQRNTSLCNVVQLSRPCWTDSITCVRKFDNIVWSDASWDIWNYPLFCSDFLAESLVIRKFQPEKRLSKILGDLLG